MVELPYSFVIAGCPRVKKNGQKVVGRGKKSRKINTPQYELWHNAALEQFNKLGFDIFFAKKNKERKDFGVTMLEAELNEPMNMQCKFYMNTRVRVDLSALYEGIQDVMQEIGLIEDDRSTIICSHDGSGVFVDKENPRMEIILTKKELT